MLLAVGGCPFQRIIKSPNNGAVLPFVLAKAGLLVHNVDNVVVRVVRQIPAESAAAVQRKVSCNLVSN